jgi:hypothetical protein
MLKHCRVRIVQVEARLGHEELDAGRPALDVLARPSE